MTTPTQLRQFAASKLTGRISTTRLETPDDKNDTSLSSVARDAVEITQDYKASGDAQAASSKMEKLQQREPAAVGTLQQISGQLTPVSYRSGPGSTFELGLGKRENLEEPVGTLYIDTTPEEPGIEFVSVLDRESHLKLDQKKEEKSQEAGLPPIPSIWSSEFWLSDEWHCQTP